jgi:Tfp pilus assembly protein PilO
MIFSLKNLDRLCLTLLVLVTMAGGYWVRGYQIKDQKRLAQEIELAIKRSAELSVVEENLHLLRKTLNVKRERFEALHQQTPETEGIGSFLKQLNNLTEKNKIGLISIRPMPPLQEKNYTRTPVQMACKGSFRGIFELLRDLEGMKGTVLMEKMAISRPNVKQACGLELTANILNYTKRKESL